MTVLSGAMTVGSVSGGAFNPAVSTGLQLSKCCVTGRCQALGYIWLYWLSHFGGAALAAGCFLSIHPRSGIKQHTGAEDNSDAWTVLPTASRKELSRMSQASDQVSQIQAMAPKAALTPAHPTNPAHIKSVSEIDAAAIAEQRLL